MATKTKKSEKITAPEGAVRDSALFEIDGEQVEIFVHDVIAEFKPGGDLPWRGRNGTGFVTSEFVYDKLGVKLDLNATGLLIGENVQSVTAFVDQFMVTSSYWEPDTGYGRQHYNDEGVMHNIGLQRLPSQGLGKLAAQALNELAHRASQVGDDEEEAKEAQMIINSVCDFGIGRTQVIKEVKTAEAFKLVEASGEKILKPVLAGTT